MPLLAGLLGGALRGGGLGGALRGMAGGRRGGGGSSGSTTPYPSPVNRDAPAAPEPEAQPQQQADVRTQPEPPQQPAQQPPTEQVAAEVAKPAVQQQAQNQSPIKGLLDEAPASKAVPTGGTQDEPIAPSIVNRTETMTPVSRPSDEQVGYVPSTFKTDGVLNQLLESGNNRQPVEFQEGLPSRTPNIEGASFSYKGPSSVAGAIPARRYGMRA